MKKALLLLSLLTLLNGCQIQYDGETKLVVTGKIQDELGKAVVHQKVGVTVGNGGGFFSNYDQISYGFTDDQGIYTLIFPAPKGEYSFDIELNSDDSQLQQKTIIAKQSNFSNYKLDLKATTLYFKSSITSLSLVLKQLAPSKQLKNVVVEGIFATPYLYLTPQVDDSIYFQTYYSIIKNQNVVLKYTVVDYSNAGQETNFVVSIPVKADAVVYTLSY
ncbi:hypothetical protein FFWV33_06015 [Flavobacterium faecale]|uniref:Uncharacterized protein n=1 Tax=Flavobacterium faecale TaxID=1355330 RepID=A0A2S1LBK4_9FLAO|nr:hypothetical protein [Flavobacterium faecale]AWG21121.1 hypothetical protein FFWV33_06015 [Flavobacterium faecale]